MKKHMIKGTRLRWVLLMLFLLPVMVAEAQQATWIWYPGDYEIWLSNRMQNRRTDRGSFFPVFWKLDSHYPLMDFHKVVELDQPEEIVIFSEGQYNVKLDGRLLEGTPSSVTIPAGRHKINVKVFCQEKVPAVFIRGKTIFSDSSWLTTFEDKEWIDETGKTSDVSATKWLKAGSWNFNDPAVPPSSFKLPVKPMQAASMEAKGNEWLVDFGKETFGFVKLHGLKGKGKLLICYGESREEALNREEAVTLDRLTVDISSGMDTVMELSKAFRYINIVKEGSVELENVSMLVEYADLENKGEFSCSDEEINRIYEVSKYTLHLSTREFFIDGIKRDRWVWSGDAYQSYLMNYYLMNDNGTVTRTMYALRGKDPVTAHINTIMDYTLYWFLGIYDYYLYSGDAGFIRQNYDRMQSLMQYVMGRRNKDGLLEGLPGDWIFIDWAAGLSKKGEVSFEQLLLARSLETMALCAGLADDPAGAAEYDKLAKDLRKKLFDLYWNENKKALVHSRVDGRQTDQVTRYANMFAIFFDYFNEQQKQEVKKSVLLNDQVQKITTPYMRFYELEALCAMGEQEWVLREMRDYWGGMLRLGATSFWEEYDPSKKGVEHYAMYGRAFGKSLCHAWGASPIYLLGRYYLGVKPTGPGYSSYVAEPTLGGLKWIKGKVPVPNGAIELFADAGQVKIKGSTGRGTLVLKSKTKPKGKNLEIREAGDNRYEITILPGVEYLVNYKSF